MVAVNHLFGYFIYFLFFFFVVYEILMIYLFGPGSNKCKSIRRLNDEQRTTTAIAVSWKKNAKKNVQTKKIKSMQIFKKGKGKKGIHLFALRSLIIP